LTDYSARNVLVPDFDGRLLFGVLPLEGELAGVEHVLELAATTMRRRLGLIVLDLGRVGPCVLRRRRLDAVTTIWEFGEPEADGGVWTSLEGTPEYERDPQDTYPDPEPI